MKLGAAVLTILLSAACQTASPPTVSSPTSSPGQPSTSPAGTTISPAARPSPTGSTTPTPIAAKKPTATSRPAPTPQIVVVRYRLERHTTDAATAGFAATVEATLTDTRGWIRAGFRLIRDDRADYRIVLGESAEVQKLCEPYDVYGKYSCQNGPVVAINADRWRYATPKWTGTLSAYRQMLVNHEVGHLLGLHHPPNPQCPQKGLPARVMSQQSTELNGCLPNPWPLRTEIERAARHDLPLAPPPN